MDGKADAIALPVLEKRMPYARTIRGHAGNFVRETPEGFLSDRLLANGANS